MKLFPCLSFIALALASSNHAQAGTPGQWTPKGPGGGGALFAPAISPHHAGELFLACDMSEVFHSTNFGAAWEVVPFREIQGGRQAFVRFTSSASILYAIDLSGDVMTPTRSLDGGATWQQLASDPTFGGAFALFTDPGATNRILVADYSNVYFSTNGGASFASKFSTASGNGCLVGGAFFDGQNIYVGTGAGLLVSTNGGASFTISAVGGIPGTQGIFSFAGAKQGGVTWLMCVTLDSGSVYPGVLIEGEYGAYQGVYSLDWGQANWTLRTNGIVSGHQPVFVAMAQNNISTAYIAGQQSAIDYPVLYRTTNGGSNWQSVLQIANNQNVFTGWAGSSGDRDWSYGAGALDLSVAPNDANQVVYTDLGFAHLSTNGGAFWKQVYVNPADQNATNANTPKGHYYRSIGLENTSCWVVTWADSNHLVAGYSDIKGVISTNGGDSWSFGYTGHSLNSMYHCVKHPVSGVLYAGTSSVHDMYQSTYLQDSRIDGGSGLVLYSTNMGVTWQTLYNAAHPVIWVATDPGNSNRLYASVIHSTLGGIFVSSNIQSGGSSSWSKLANPPGTSGHPFNIRVLNDGMLVCTYSGRRDSAGAFTASSGVFVSTNAGASWVNRSHTNMAYWTKDLVVDPNDPAQNTWYVGVFSGWGGPPNGLGGLYRTTNRGLAWTRISNLDRVTSCAFNPANTNELYLTTETDGLWISTNINAVSPTFSAVTSYPFRQPERVFFNPYRPGEVWVTSFGNGIKVGTTASQPGTLRLNAAGQWPGGTTPMTLQQATPGAPYALLGSSNLSTWNPLVTNWADANGTVQFNATNAGGGSRYYYKTQAR